MGDGKGIVHWGVVMPIDLGMEPPVELVKVGDDRPGVSTRYSAARSARAAPQASRGWVTLSPTIVSGDAGGEDAMGPPRGRRRMLNSADGVTLPWPIAPPISTIRSIRSVRSGCSASSRAMFVNGPIGTSVCDRSRRGARDQLDGVDRLPGRVTAAGRSGPSRPGLPVDLALRPGRGGSARGRHPPPPGCGCALATSRTRIALAVTLLQRLVPGHGRDQRGELEFGAGRRGAGGPSRRRGLDRNR